MGGLVVDEAEVAEGGVPPVRVVERLDVVEHRPGELCPRVLLVAVQQLALQRREEAFGDRVVEGVADGAHRAEQPSVAESLPEHPRAVLRPVVRVNHGARRLAAQTGHLQRVDHEFGTEDDITSRSARRQKG